MTLEYNKRGYIKNIDKTHNSSIIMTLRSKSSCGQVHIGFPLFGHGIIIIL